MIQLVDFLRKSMKQKANQISLGEKLFSWEAHDHHPHVRKPTWYVVFCSIFFGVALASIWLDPVRGWITAFSFCIIAAFYFWSHKNGNDTHVIEVYKNALSIDGKIFPLESFKNYWFVYGENVAVINFDKKHSKKNEKIKLQMGRHGPEFFRENLSATFLKEDTKKKESLVDLWIRALQL